jgi:hypothetical protein
MDRRLSTVLRGVVVLAGAVCGGTAACRLAVRPAAVLVGPLLADGPAGVEGLAFEDALVGLCAAVLLGCLLWLAVGAALTVTAYVARELAPDSRLVSALARAVDRGSPAAVGRLVGGALGVVVTVGLAGPAGSALAQPVPTPPGPAGTVAGAQRLSGLPLPERPSGAAHTSTTRPTAPPVTTRPETTGAETTRPESTGAGRRPAAAGVVVRPGQSLWAIAERLLSPAATDAQITRAWHRLHRANESTIGVDPDLILPGTRLVVPRLTAPPTREEAP